MSELVDQLHGFADWLEKSNHVHTHSVPRRAAYTITRLEEENEQLRLQLNKRDLTLSDIVNRIVGKIRLYIYLTKKKWSLHGHR